jgi:hypothetical protein
MTRLTISLKNALAIVKKRINFENEADNDPEMVMLFQELLTATTALHYRKQFDKRLADFDHLGKDKEFANTVWEGYKFS